MIAHMKQPVVTRNLHKLLSGFVSVMDFEDISVFDLKLDSRKINAGDLFVALKGTQDNGLAYVESAKSRGAAAVVTDAQNISVEVTSEFGIPVIEVPKLREHLGEIAGRFFGQPSKYINLVGITGTNGKTSCCQFIAQALSGLGVQCGVIGTLGYGHFTSLRDIGHTTPDAITLQRILVELLSEEFPIVAMEVSSHGLDQGRANGVLFNTAIFTNLTRDHLDYHGDMESYGESKARLFKAPGIEQAIINIDDSFGCELAAKVADGITVYRYALDDQTADVSVSNIQVSERGLHAVLRSPWGKGIITSSLLGRFNLSNLLAVFTFLCSQGVVVDQALAAVADVKTADGRMQSFGGGGFPLVVVDYAHTPDALAAALTTLKEICQGKLWCVFGCGGNRDQGKREIMGMYAEELADEVVLTNDNPRQEAPEDIVLAIKVGMRSPEKVHVELNRASAIQLAITQAQAGDVVLIAGKGHENYQEIGGARTAFNDGEQVKQALTIKTVISRNANPLNGDE